MNLLPPPAPFLIVNKHSDQTYQLCVFKHNWSNVSKNDDFVPCTSLPPKLVVRLIGWYKTFECLTDKIKLWWREYWTWIPHSHGQLFKRCHYLQSLWKLKILSLYSHVLFLCQGYVPENVTQIEYTYVHIHVSSIHHTTTAVAGYDTNHLT
jgi:hypothetical protein